MIQTIPEGSSGDTLNNGTAALNSGPTDRLGVQTATFRLRVVSGRADVTGVFVPVC